MPINIPSRLTDTALVAAIKHLATGEREATAQLIAHLAELDARGLYAGAGYSSMFAYCCGVLHLSEDAAYNRIETARAAHKFPVILTGLADGSLNVTTVRLLARRLTPENHAALLAAAAGRSKREVEELVARHYPQPDVASSVRKAPTRPSEAARPLELESVAPAAPPPVLSMPPSVSPPPASHRPQITPLSEDRYLIKFTVSAATQKKLRKAQDLLRHSNPSGDPAEIFDRALTLLIEGLERQKFAATKSPRKSKGVSPNARHIPANVRRHSAHRDNRSCGFVGTGGHRCGDRGFLEFHHVEPVVNGGRGTAGNIELRCRAHNRYEAELQFGGTMNLASAEHGPERVGGAGKEGLKAGR